MLGEKKPFSLRISGRSSYPFPLLTVFLGGKLKDWPLRLSLALWQLSKIVSYLSLGFPTPPLILVLGSSTSSSEVLPQYSQEPFLLSSGYNHYQIEHFSRA